MTALFISLLFWLLGFVIILGGKIVNKLLVLQKKKLDEKAESEAHQNNVESYQSTIGEQVIDVIPGEAIRIVFTIVGMIVFVFGFVSLGFWVR